jgi:GMP synthase-like glutamine amidotransferase
MANCSPDAFAMAGRGETPMNVVAVFQHTSGEYLGLMEDHLEGRRIRFQYFRPFAGGSGKLPDSDLPADALFLLGGGPWGSAGSRDLPTIVEEVDFTRAMLEQGTPVVGIGLGAQILAIAAGGSSEIADFVFECRKCRRTDSSALNGYLPDEFMQVVYMRDRPVLPEGSKILAVDESEQPAVFQVADNAYGFVGHPGIKLGIIEDLIMEFEEVPGSTYEGLEELRGLQSRIEDDLVPIMTGLVQCTDLMSSPRAAAGGSGELENSVV